MSLNALAHETWLDVVFSHPEHTSMNCPTRSRERLKGLLEAASPMVYQAEGLVAWMNYGGLIGTFHYMAASPECLQAELQPMLDQFLPLWEAEGVRLLQVFTATDTGCATLEAAGFTIQHRTMRMRAAAVPMAAPDERLRPVRPEDGDAVLDIMLAAFPDQCPDREAWRSTIFSNREAWLIEHEGVPAGFILVDETEHTLLINGLGIDPRRQSGGLGRALVGKVLELAYAQGKEGVQVLADHQPGVLAFYQRNGFSEVHPASLLLRQIAGD